MDSFGTAMLFMLGWLLFRLVVMPALPPPPRWLFLQIHLA
jgi:hypothetical protein